MKRLTKILVVVVFACAHSTVEWTPEQDDEAMLAIENTWTTGGASLSLCEDFAAEPPPPYEEPEYGYCSNVHIVRGHGRGYAHELDVGGVGCGGCSADVVAFVQGTLSGAGLAKPVQVRGTIMISRIFGASDAAYEFPFGLDLSCVGSDGPCKVGGQIAKDGTLTLQVWQDAFATGTPAFETTIARTAAATCAAP